MHNYLLICLLGEDAEDEIDRNEETENWINSQLEGFQQVPGVEKVTFLLNLSKNEHFISLFLECALIHGLQKIRPYMMPHMPKMST